MIRTTRKLNSFIAGIMVFILLCGCLSSTTFANEIDFEKQEIIGISGNLRHIIPESSKILQYNDNDNSIKVQNDDGTTSIFIFDRKSFFK